MPKILITGASGFVGSWLVSEALKRDLEVYAGVRKSSSREFLQDPRIQFFNTDFRDEEGLFQGLNEQQFDYVIHNAGVVRVLDKQVFYDVNYGYTKLLIETLQAVKSKPKKFVYMSSLASCGSADHSPEGAITNRISPNPPTHYGKSKNQAESFIMSQTLPYLIFRPTAVYGPRDKDVLKLFKGVSVGIAPLIGTRPSKLSFIYVKDLARLILDATLSNKQNEAYVVSDGKIYANNAFHKKVAKIMGKKAIYPKIPMSVVKLIASLTEVKSKLTKTPDTLDIDKVNELKARNWVCDISELKKDFNFAPQYSTEESLTETYEWYKKHNWL